MKVMQYTVVKYFTKTIEEAKCGCGFREVPPIFWRNEMKAKTKIIAIVALFFAFALISCEKKSLNEQLYKEVFPDKETPNLTKIEKLIQKGADVNYNNMIKDLVSYIPDSYNETLKLLIQYGADVNYYIDNEDEFDGYNIALFSKRYLVNDCSTNANLETIINNGAPVEIDCGNGITPLIIKIEELRTLSEENFDSGLQIVETMIKNGADVNHVSDKGITPLLTALEYAEREVIDLLIKYGAKIRTENIEITVGVNPGNPFAEHMTDTSVTVNHSEVNLLALGGYKDILQNFLETSGYNPYLRAPNGLDLFCYAVMSDDYETVKMVMKYCNTINKKQYNIKDRDGNNHYYTLYGIADYSDCEESKRALAEYGADRSL